MKSKTNSSGNRKKKEIPSKKSDADRRIRQADRLARVLRVLQFIQSRGRWTVSAIADELECSERTVYRDLNVLEFAGVPHFTDSQDQCIRVRPDYRFPVLDLTDDELIGQSTATAVTQAPNLNVNVGAKPTTEKIAASNPDAEVLLAEAAQLTRVLDLKLADHSQHHETIRTVQWALLERKQLVGHYRSPYEPKPVKLTLHLRFRRPKALGERFNLASPEAVF